jgi:inorganic pyrophosphatase
VKGWRDAAFARNKVVEAQARWIEHQKNPEAKPVPKS